MIWRAEIQTRRDKIARWLIGLLILACLLGLYLTTRWNVATQTAIIGKAWISDGDTIEVSGTRIRL